MQPTPPGNVLFIQALASLVVGREVALRGDVAERMLRVPAARASIIGVHGWTALVGGKLPSVGSTPGDSGVATGASYQNDHAMLTRLRITTGRSGARHLRRHCSRARPGCIQTRDSKRRGRPFDIRCAHELEQSDVKPLVDQRAFGCVVAEYSRTGEVRLLSVDEVERLN